MTVRAERTFDLAIPPDRVWEFIADPGNRARSISVVTDYTIKNDDATHVTWHVELPIPLVRRTIAIETEDVSRQEPTYVRFVGRSKVMDVTGEHEIAPNNGGSILANRFTVEGKLPGVEKFFKRNLDAELENLRRDLQYAAQGDADSP